MTFTYAFDQLRSLTAQQLNLRFMNYEYTMEHGGVDPENYFTADSGTIKATSELAACEALYRMYNIDFPAGYTGRSMSVSDIVNLWDNDAEPSAKKSFFCDSFGFKEL